ncbi:hypothetical protein [Deefgea salmonis]|uniref:Glycoside hydrolase n=1 Tax=Deefgea salmonis TaxID=2875502 RepID=A0ABS8BN86_9NEIS|nr:hypothetical protein [Deefgea salmonis]MCB5197180.1 hypothetical protein [Deefgea salmonis]
MAMLAFYDVDFPFWGVRPSHMPQQAVMHCADTLSDALNRATMPAVFVHLHGRYFPAAAWPALLDFLHRGGNMLTLGQAVFSQPVGANGQHQPQAALFRQLDIHEIQNVDAAHSSHLAAGANFPWLSEHLEELDLNLSASTDSLVLMPTKTKDQPLDSGSAGPMDARIYPLLMALDAQQQHIASPIVLIERLRGAMAGSRQVFANITPDEQFWQQGGMALLEQLATHAAYGVTECWLKPDFACYEPGEHATLTLQAEALGQAQGQNWTATITTRYRDAVIDHKALQLNTHHAGLQSLRFTLPHAIAAGLYTLQVELRSEQGDVIDLQQGFWGRDAELLARGTRMRAGRDYFIRDGKTTPIVGMTYMAGDVHRKFLHLPNVALWQQEMGTLASMGVNYLRTGIWSAWRQLMFVDGHANEALLRAIDAFILTAASHDLECCFTFFAFTPEAWEGRNPYLDPRSRSAQKRFIRSIVSRHTDTKRVHWDLINEPSLFDPQRIFVGPRSLGDALETRAFIQHLQAINPDLGHWQRAWDLSPAQLADWSAVRPPQPEDIGFNTTEIAVKQHGIWLDYALFTQAVHREWAADLAASIKALIPDVMVCVGQDEALGQQRPSPFFFADAVDYTSVHSWWLNDALGWDSLFSKTPNTPNLIQETGIMHVARANGRSRRTEAELMQLLERKYAYAYSYGNAGAVQWIWNCNYHMDNINESHIGACRADGSQKPEAAITAAFGQFIKNTGVWLENRQLANIAVVYPFSNDYSNRRTTLAATQAMVRNLAFEFGANLRAVGEHDLSSLFAAPPQLLLLPCPQNMDATCWQQIEQLLAEHPITVLLTGPATLDRYFNPCQRAPFHHANIRNLSREETLHIADATYRASYIGEASAQLDTGCDAAGLAEQIEHFSLGQGQVIWCPLPLELNANSGTLSALYQYAMNAAGIQAAWHWIEAETGKQIAPAPAGIFLQQQPFAAHTLWIAVNESSRARTLHWQAGEHRYRTELAAGRALLWLTDQHGVVIDSLWQHPVEKL